MAELTIPDLTAATLPLAGTELIELSVPGTPNLSRKTTLQDALNILRPKSASPAFSATPTLATGTGRVLYFGELTANVTAFNLSGTEPLTTVVFKQDATGSRTVTAGTSIDFGATITNLAGIASAANAYTYVTFAYHPTTAKFRPIALST